MFYIVVQLRVPTLDTEVSCPLRFYCFLHIANEIKKNKHDAKNNKQSNSRLNQVTSKEIDLRSPTFEELQRYLCQAILKCNL